MINPASENTRLSIAENGAALRVHESLGNQTLQTMFAERNPVRIVRLSNLDAGVFEEAAKCRDAKGESITLAR